MIAGPEGVGKTTSLYYLLHKLREPKDALVVWSSASVMRTLSTELKYHLDNILEPGKIVCYSNHCQLLSLCCLPCVSCTQNNAELLEKCDWNKNMEDNLKMIIKSESMKKHYLLLDAGCSSNKEKMESLYSLAQLGILIP